MSEHSAGVLGAYQAIREGHFDLALERAREAFAKDDRDFYAWYMAALAAGHLDDRQQLREYIDAAARVSQQSPYLNYLKAYVALWDGDAEKALWLWSELISEKEGWLAKELIEKARKKKPLIEMAKKGQFADFVILPDFLDEIAPEPTSAPVESAAESEAKPIRTTRSMSRLVWLSISIVFFLASVAYVVVKGTRGETGGPSTGWQQLQIKEWANVVPSQRDVQFTYTTRDELIKDFDAAKVYLRQGNINQARYLLQRLVLSNADFKSKEKSKIFLNFIPIPPYEEFRDSVTVPELLNEKDFYLGAVVLWEGTLLQARDVDKGKQIRMVVRHEGKDYIVEGFLPTGEPDRAILPYGDFNHNEEKDQSPSKKVIGYGVFKGLLGNQKAIYIELVKVWM